MSYAGKYGKEFVFEVIAKDQFGEAPCFNDTAEVKVTLIKLKKLLGFNDKFLSLTYTINLCPIK